MKSTQEITQEVRELGQWIPALRQQVGHVVIGQKYLVDRLLLGLFVAMWWVTHLAASCIHQGQRARFDRSDRRDKGIFRLGRLWLLDILRRATTSAALTWCLPFQKKGTTWRFALRF